MASTSSNSVNMTIEVAAMRNNTKVELNSIPLTMTIGEVKKKLNVQPNARFGRLNEFENWDNRRPLSDYFVKNGEEFSCVVQCVMEDGQPSCDDYDEWLSTKKPTN